MGYWSDWSVPILVTTAAAFTYIAGLLVWVEGFPWAHVGLLLVEGDMACDGGHRVLLLPRPLECCLGLRPESSKVGGLILRVSFGCPFGSPFPPLPQPLPLPLGQQEPFWLSAPATGTYQKGLPTLNVLHTERLRLTTFCTRGSWGQSAGLLLSPRTWISQTVDTSS